MKTSRVHQLLAVVIALAAIGLGIKYFASDGPAKPNNPEHVSSSVPSVMTASNDAAAPPAPTAPPYASVSKTPIMDKASLLSRYDRLAHSSDPVDAPSTPRNGRLPRTGKAATRSHG